MGSVPVVDEIGLEELLALDVRSMTSGERSEWVVAMDRARSRFDNAFLAGLGEWDARADWALDSDRSGSGWLARRCDLRRGVAHGLLGEARKLRAFPATAAAASGLGANKVRTMLRFVNPRTREAYAANEEFLLAQAGPLTVDETAQMMQFWAVLADPDGANPADPSVNEFRLSQTLEGRWRVDGNLDAVTGTLLFNALAPIVDRLYRAHKKGGDGIARSYANFAAEALGILVREATMGRSGDGVPAQPSATIVVDYEYLMDLVGKQERVAREPNAGAQANPTDHDHADPEPVRHAATETVGQGDAELAGHADAEHVDDRDDVLADQSGCGHDHRDSDAGDAHIDAETDALKAAVAAGVGGSLRPVAMLGDVAVRRETARRLCCDAGINRMVTKGPSIILDAGRTVRTVTEPMRKRMRDRCSHCEWPGCDLPERWTSAHHIAWWGRDQGKTNIGDLAFLCAWHHYLVHEAGWKISRNADGDIEIRRPDGTLLQWIGHSA